MRYKELDNFSAFCLHHLTNNKSKVSFKEYIQYIKDKCDSLDNEYSYSIKIDRYIINQRKDYIFSIHSVSNAELNTRKTVSIQLLKNNKFKVKSNFTNTPIDNHTLEHSATNNNIVDDLPYRIYDAINRYFTQWQD